jgi:exopolysaccharide biosynthesis polyprenyl glycosylphosphotransferase
MTTKLIERFKVGAPGAATPHTEAFNAPPPLEVELALDRSHGAERWSVLRRMLATGDLAAAAVAGLVAALVSGLTFEPAVVFFVLVALGWPVIAFACGLYAAEDLRSWASGASEMPRLVLAALLMSWPLFAVLTLPLDAPHSAQAALIAAVGTAVLSVPSRGAARGFVHLSEPLRQRTVIVGSGRVAARLTHKLRAHREFGLNPVGIVDDDVHEAENLDLPVLGRLQELSAVLRTHAVDRVIIAFSRADHEELLSSIRACRDARIAVDVVPRLFEFLDGARALDQIGGLPLISIGVHRLSPASRVAKRGLDVVVSALALVVLAPLFVLVGAGVRAESRGKVFFRQSRAGQDGEVFSLLKFRSMYADAELRVSEFRENGVVLKGGEDPRVTRVGKLLRRFSIDELPQLINVFLGHMSLVGPRPLVLSEAAAMGETWQERRLDLRPGMTGLWQVSGRSNIPFHEMLRFDYQYVAGWSLARDLEILLSTIPVVLSGRGAL